MSLIVSGKFLSLSVRPVPYVDKKTGEQKVFNKHEVTLYPPDGLGKPFSVNFGEVNPNFKMHQDVQVPVYIRCWPSRDGKSANYEFCFQQIKS